MTDQPLPRLHLLEEVAEKYRLSFRSLRERAWRREFAHISIGRKRYLTDEQVAELLKASTVGTAQSDGLDAVRARRNRARRTSRAKRAA